MKGGTHTKLIKKLAIALATLATTLAISTTALADTKWGFGKGGGEVPTPQRGSFMYSFTNSNELSWKIDMYVSCSETGQVDPATDVIDGPNLQWVGAVLYDNWFKDWQATIDVKIQTRYTNIRTRLDTSYMTPITKNGMTVGYTVPLTGVTALFEEDGTAEQSVERRFAEMAHSWRTICDFSGKNKNRLASLV